MWTITDAQEATPVCWDDMKERSQGKPPHTTELRGNSVRQSWLSIPAADIPTRAATASSSANSKPVSVWKPERNMASERIEDPDSILWLEITILQEEIFALPGVAHFLQDHNRQQVALSTEAADSPWSWAQTLETPGASDKPGRGMLVAGKDSTQGSRLPSQYQGDTKIMQDKWN